MRTRSRTLGTRQVSGNYTVYRSYPDDIITGDYGLHTYPLGDEVITDEENGPYSMRTKFVSHQKAKNSYNLAPANYTLHGGLINGRPWNETYSLPGPAISNWERALLYDPPDVGPSLAVCRKAMETITPTLESGFDATVFVAELAEFKTLFTFFKSTDSLFRNFSNANLTYAFGWAPMVKDLTKLVKALSNYNARIERFKRESKSKELKRYFQNVSKEEYDSGWFKIEPLSGYNYSTSLGPVYNYAQVKWTRNITENFTFRYTYTIPELSEDQQKIRAFLDTVGLHADGAVLWELLPYSFVIDWFIPIGDYFKRKRRKWWPATINMLNCSYSRKVEQTTYLSYRNCYEDTGQQRLFMVRKIEKYNRYPMDLSAFYVRDDLLDLTDSLSLRKIFLGSLLLEQAVTNSEIKRIMRSQR